MDPKWDRWCDDEPTVDELIVQFERLIYSISRQCSRSYHLSEDDREDLVQTMFTKLLAIPSDKRAYPGYVKMAINNAVRTGLRQVVGRGATPGHTWKDHNTTDYESAVAGYANTDEVISPLDYLAGTNSPESTCIDSLMVDRALATLTPREQACVDHSRTLREIADDLGVTYEYVRQIRIRALAKLKRALTKCK